MEISVLRGEWGCEILVDSFCLEFWKFFASPSLCAVTVAMSLIYLIHSKYIFYLLTHFTQILLLFFKIILFLGNKVFFEILNCKRGHMPILC